LVPDNILVLRRELKTEGRGRVLVNGLTSSLALLQQIGPALLLIQSQDQQREMSSPDFTRNYLDRLLGLQPELADLGEARDQWHRLASELATLRQEVDFARQQQEMWSYQQRELAAMGLDANEEEKLGDQLDFARNARALLDAAGLAIVSLTEQEACARSTLAAAESSLAAVADSSRVLADLSGQLELAAEIVGEVSRGLERFMDTAEVDPVRCDELEKRKAEYEGLKRKYAVDVTGLIALEDELRELLSRQQHATENIEALEREVELAATAVGLAAARLRRKRQDGAGALARRAEDLIKPLALGEISLEFLIEPREQSDSNFVVEGVRCEVSKQGADRVSLRVQTNRGEAAGEVSAIASGGEKSRIFLGLSVLACGENDQRLMLFDEIDAGLGMDNAIPVARLLAQLATGRQVLCITHLATVAAWGKSHWKVEKTINNERTALSVTALSETDRLAEIARLLGGEKAGVGDSADSRLAYAKQLLGGTTHCDVI